MIADKMLNNRKIPDRVLKSSENLRKVVINMLPPKKSVNSEESCSFEGATP